MLMKVAKTFATNALALYDFAIAYIMPKVLD